jgi:ABC-2 type transport system ATP-binding protein
MSATDLVDVRDLLVVRGEFRLEVPEWAVAPGQVVGLVGPNGAGKTTLLETIAGLRAPDRGRVQVLGGIDPWDEPVRARSALGFMSEDMPLFQMKVGALLKMLSGYYPSWDAKLVDSLLERFSLAPDRKVGALSRGEGTRLRLVTAMAFRPRLLVLDEPAGGMDLSGRRRLVETVLEIVRDPERSVIVSSHVLADLERIADRLLVLHRGKVVREGPTSDLVSDGSTLEEAVEAWGVA